MNIGIFTDAYEPHISGVTTSINMLKTAIENMGHTVYIVTANLNERKFVYDQNKRIIYIPGIKTGIYQTRLTSIYSSKAMNIIKNWNLDVIHSQTEFGIGTFSRIVAKKLNIPVVHTYHTLYEDYVYYVTHGHFDNLAKKFVVKFTKYFCDKKCDELIVPTDKIKDLFNNKYNINRHINVIPTGIDLSRFDRNKEMDSKINKIKKNNKIKNTDFIIGSVGRIAEEKSLDKLLKNSKKLIKANNNIKLMIVGDGPFLENLKKIANNLGIQDNVIFTGKIEYKDIPIYFNAFDIIATFSTSETQGLTIIEGLAASKPTLCINDDSFKSMIESGYNGYLFHDDNEFIEQVFELMSNKEVYNKMAINARNSTYKFSKEVFAADVLKVYHKAIERKNKKTES